MNGSLPPPLAALWRMAGQQPAQGPTPSRPLSPSDMALAWLHLWQQNPAMLAPNSLATRQEIHGILNQRMRDDPYGIASFLPPGPSIQQQMQQRWRPAPPMTPELERSLMFRENNAVLKGLPGASPFKSGVTMTQTGEEWGL